MAVAFAEVSLSNCTGRDRPWRNALRLDFNRPAAVLGPVLFFALTRLAAICFSVAIEALLLLVVSARTVAPGAVLLAEQATTVFPGRHHALEHLQARAFQLHGLGLEFCHRNPMLRQQRDDLLFLVCIAAEIIQSRISQAERFLDVFEVVL